VIAAGRNRGVTEEPQNDSIVAYTSLEYGSPVSVIRTPDPFSVEDFVPTILSLAGVASYGKTILELALKWATWAAARL
jgi:hypothetical protein